MGPPPGRSYSASVWEQLAEAKPEFVLSMVPQKHQYLNLCKIAVVADPNTLRHVRRSLLCDELYDLALKQDGCALRYLPTEAKTLARVKAAMKDTPFAAAFLLIQHPKLACCGTSRLGFRAFPNVPQQANWCSFNFGHEFQPR